MKHAIDLIRWPVLVRLAPISLLIGTLLTSCMVESREPTPTPIGPTVSALPTEPAVGMPTPVEPQPGERPAAVADADAYLIKATLARGYLTTPNELRRIGALARAGQEPYKTAVAAELRYAADALAQKPIDVPKVINFDDDIDTPAYLSVGAKYLYAWAIAYNLLRDSAPQQAAEYARRAHEWIMAMPVQNTQIKDYNDNTRLNLSVYIENFIYTADLLADWTPSGGGKTFAEGLDAQRLKQWLGEVIVRYPYNAAHTRMNNWGAWGQLTIAVIADYVGDAAPLYVQRMVKNQDGAYEVDPEMTCDSGELNTCVNVDARTMYANAIQLHDDMVDGKLYEFSFSSCDSGGSKSMIRPDGGIPDELRRQYSCDTTTIEDPYGAAARYSQFALEAMTSLAEVAWRRGDAGVYTHIDQQTGRGALYRGVQFLIDNNVTLTRGSMLEMLNRFYTYQVGVEGDQTARHEYEQLLSHDLPGILKHEGEWPEGPGFVSFGTLTHGFATGERLRPPPLVAPR